MKLCVLAAVLSISITVTIGRHTGKRFGSEESPGTNATSATSSPMNMTKGGNARCSGGCDCWLGSDCPFCSWCHDANAVPNGDCINCDCNFNSPCTLCSFCPAGGKSNTTGSRCAGGCDCNTQSDCPWCSWCRTANDTISRSCTNCDCNPNSPCPWCPSCKSGTRGSKTDNITSDSTTSVNTTTSIKSEYGSGPSSSTSDVRCAGGCDCNTQSDCPWCSWCRTANDTVSRSCTNCDCNPNSPCPLCPGCRSSMLSHTRKQTKDGNARCSGGTCDCWFGSDCAWCSWCFDSSAVPNGDCVNCDCNWSSPCTLCDWCAFKSNMTDANNSTHHKVVAGKNQGAHKTSVPGHKGKQNKDWSYWYSEEESWEYKSMETHPGAAKSHTRHYGKSTGKVNSTSV